MAYTFNGSSQYLTTTTTPVAVAPLTMACWFNSTSSTTSQNLIQVCSAAGNDSFRLLIAGAVAAKPVRVATTDSVPTQITADTTAGYTTNTWTHACGVFASTTSRTAYINGGNSGANTTSVNPQNVDRIRSGATINNSTISQYFAGQIAEVAIWNAALSAAEVLSLSQRASPLLIRPQSLVFYAPNVSNLTDLIGARTITNNGTATVSAHPRIYY